MQWQIYTPSARAKGAAKPWCRNVDVHVVLVDDSQWGGDFSSINSPCVLRKYTFGRVDSRYTGPKSAYGQCMSEARAKLAELNTEWGFTYGEPA